MNNLASIIQLILNYLTMKKITTFLLVLFISATTFGQFLFVHTTTAGNISADASYIDHPDLNNNPAAQLLISHNWNPPGSPGVLNDNATGVFYSSTQNQWGVYNESGASMVLGSSYNVYIDQGSDITLHIADLANQGSLDSYSVINHPNLNNNPAAQIILTTYFTPNGVRNNNNYAVWYSDTINRWIIFTEDLSTIPLDSAFFVGIEGTATQTITHTANAGNISSNWTEIDNSLLNNNPDALLVFTHNWGETGDPANVILDKVLGVWYTGSRWAIYVEDQTAMPLNIEFDIMILDPSLGITDNAINEFSLFPNPVKDQLNISTTETISAISIYNILGQEVATFKGDNVQLNVNVSELSSGTYIIKVQAGETQSSKKFIKL